MGRWLVQGNGDFRRKLNKAISGRVLPSGVIAHMHGSGKSRTLT
jgi:hypothetical protein